MLKVNKMKTNDKSRLKCKQKQKKVSVAKPVSTSKNKA